MAQTPAWRRYARFFGVDIRRDVDDELLFHLDAKTRDLIAHGATPEEARAEALRQFGEVADVRRLCEAWGDSRERTIERRGYWIGWCQDLRYAARTLRNDPGFTLAALLILACGIGATTAIVSVVEALLLRPLPIAEPSRVIWVDNLGQNDEGDVSTPTLGANSFLNWQRHNRSFEALEAYMSFFGYLGSNLTAPGADPERLGLVPVSEHFFAVLGISPAIGRTFTADELEPLDRLVAGNAPRTVLLTDALWRRRFAADPGIVGRTITLNGQPSRVVGVMPARFDFAEMFAPGSQVDLFTPLRLDEQAEKMGNMLAVVGRLRPGISIGAAQSDLANLARAQPSKWNRVSGARLSRLHDHVALGISRPLIVLAAAVGLVLLMICVNLATLLLARATGRQKEMAVRAALGASRARLLRQMLTESLLLSGAGALLGLPLASLAVHAINTLQDSRLPLTSLVAIDGRVLAFITAVTVATGVIFGLLPAIRATRGDARAALSESARGSSGGRERAWTRNVLVVTELALACVLLVGAGLLLRSFVRLMETDRGFTTQRVATARLDLGANYVEPVRLEAFIAEVRRQIGAAPGTLAVGFTDALPLDRNRDWGVVVPGERNRGISAYVSLVSPGYLDALGVKVAEGRLFTDADRSDSEHVVVIGQALAHVLWPNTDALGRVLGLNDKTYRVVGVVGDLRNLALEETPQPQMYFALTQNPSGYIGSLDLVVRATTDAAAARQVMAAAVRGVDPAQPIGRLRTLDDLVARSVSPRRFLLALITAFAVMALVLASLGIYGVIAQGVAQRRREIGIRLALGATAGEILRAVIGQALLLALAGLALGLIATFALTKTIASLLYGLSATDAATHLIVVALLFTVALLAALVPARRAARVDPASALRAD
jgi:predicted permease